jgi:hypothetical protein
MCSLCSNAINSFETLPFVESVQTDLNKNLFTIPKWAVAALMPSQKGGRRDFCG